jgi:hypothetical protein
LWGGVVGVALLALLRSTAAGGGAPAVGRVHRGCIVGDSDRFGGYRGCVGAIRRGSGCSGFWLLASGRASW